MTFEFTSTGVAQVMQLVGGLDNCSAESLRDALLDRSRNSSANYVDLASVSGGDLGALQALWSAAASAGAMRAKLPISGSHTPP